MRTAEIIIASVLLSCVSAAVSDFSGRVVGVSDGDTITVMHDGKGEKIRLYGIDAQKGQAFGNRAKVFVSALAFGKEVKIEAKGQDRYGRTIADVILPDGRNLNREIMKVCFAWWGQEVCAEGHRVRDAGIRGSVS